VWKLRRGKRGKELELILRSSREVKGLGERQRAGIDWEIELGESESKREGKG
jgi:hypothetical protein